MPDKDNIRFYQGNSMRGTFRSGDCLLVMHVLLAELRPGDVVVYRGQNEQGQADELVHRVVAVAAGAAIAKGDNNPRADTTPITSDNLLGRVTHVQRNGKTRQVWGGQLGLMRARIFRIGKWARRWIVRLGRGPYCWLRGSGLILRLWQPSVLRVRLVTKDGPLVKYVHDGQTVARWRPTEGRFDCQKPYDLVLRPEDTPGKDHAMREGDYV